VSSDKTNPTKVVVQNNNFDHYVTRENNKEFTNKYLKSSFYKKYQIDLQDLCFHDFLRLFNFSSKGDTITEHNDPDKMIINYMPKYEFKNCYKDPGQLEAFFHQALIRFKPWDDLNKLTFTHFEFQYQDEWEQFIRVKQSEDLFINEFGRNDSLYTFYNSYTKFIDDNKNIEKYSIATEDLSHPMNLNCLNDRHTTPSKN
jgi:hypothetical protein